MLDWINAEVGSNLVNVAIGLFGFLGTIFATAKVVTAKVKPFVLLAKEIIDVSEAVGNASDPNSPGGVKWTNDEYAKVGKEVVEAIESGKVAFKKKSNKALKK